MAAQAQVPQDRGKLHLQGQIAQLPSRPDDTVLSESIPLFFIGHNQSGFWVARESEGRSGGVFLFKRSAARFARKQSAPGGCATMFVEHGIELDLPHQNRFVAPTATTMDVIKRHAPLVAILIGMAIAEWRKLGWQISHALASKRRNLQAIENDLFRSQYKLVSKNDDDLPIPR